METDSLLNTNSTTKLRNVAIAGAAGIAATVVGANAVSANSVAVKSGDTLSGISQSTGVSVEQLKSINHLNSDTIQVGQQLNTDTNEGQNNNNQSTYTVKAGDTLSGIAQMYNTTVDELKSNNNLSSDLIFPGQQLSVNGAVTNESTYTPQSVETNTTAQSQTPSQQSTTQTAPVTPQTNTNDSNYASNVSGSEAAAKAWIAQHESGGNYNASNGQYIGKYQLSSSYLNGDYSPANQERVADQYVANRYGSWTAAQQFWQTHNWY